MSINNLGRTNVVKKEGARFSDDPDRRREDQAKLAGHVIYSSVHSEHQSGSNLPPPNIPPPMADPVAAQNHLVSSVMVDPMAEGKMSSVRRTFCLFVLFDLILMFILWVIYTQLIGEKGYSAFEKQVKDYDFKTSLFDAVMLSAVRFTFLLLAYALFRIQHWWMVAVTTSLTCGMLITKIFLFDFEGNSTSNNPLSYVLIIISFVLAWAETWFMDFKVLPQEKKLLTRLQQSYHRDSPYTEEVRTEVLNMSESGYGSVLGGGEGRYHRFPDDIHSVITEDNNQFYSPMDTPEGSDTEQDRTDGPHSRYAGSRFPDSRQENDYIRLARHCFEVLWTYVKSPDSDWKMEAGKDFEKGVVHSKKIKGIGTVFRLTAVVDYPLLELFKEINNRPEEMSNWNPTLKESKILQVVDDHTDILYSVSNELAGGAISSRDFVNIRTSGMKEGIMLGAGMSVNHPDKPPQKDYVRAENGIGGFVYKPLLGEPSKCIFQWYMNTDIKGWFPKKLVDATMAKTQLDFLSALRVHLTKLKS